MSGPSQTLWGLETIGTSAVLWHRLGHLPLETNRTRINPRKVPRTIHQLIRWSQQSYYWIWRHWPKKLQLQNSQRKGAMQSPQTQPQHLRTTTINYVIFKSIYEIKNPQPDPNSIRVFNPHNIVKDNTPKQFFMPTEISKVSISLTNEWWTPSNFNHPIWVQGYPENRFHLGYNKNHTPYNNCNWSWTTRTR